MNEDCIFCKIVKGEIPSTKVYEDERVIAFNDINPIAPIHILVIPKTHIDNYMELDDTDLIIHVNKIIKKIAIEKGLNKNGFRVLTNIGEDGGQAVKHLHYHILGGTKLPTR
ncbi:MAG: histidine triad nucleotide-binding protein [Clostridia bacterium]|nr:histidine triad nucleotide-binding protein [Clostridia bacterium]